MASPAGRIWPVCAAAAIYLAAVAAVVAISVRRNDGRFVYPLDDTYIHMAIAKHAALDHVWGVTPYAFTSSTSSPLWTLLLAATYAVVGVGTLSPLVWNAVAAILAIATTDRWLRARGARPTVVFALLMALVFGAALPTLTVI